MAGIHRYFKPIAGLPRPSETNIGERATTEANTAVQNVLEKQQQTGKRKRKAYTSFGDEQRAKIGRYAAENGTAATLRKFKSDVPDLGESMVQIVHYTQCPHIVLSSVYDSILSAIISRSTIDSQIALIRKFTLQFRKTHK